MGFLCHQLELQAMDLWFCGSGHMELRQVYAPEGASVLSQLLWCRAVLSTQLLDAVSAQGRAVWFGASPEQASLLSRAGGGKAVIGVPCPESPAACAAVGPPTRPSSGGVAGVLLLYCSHALDRTPQLAQHTGVVEHRLEAARLGWRGRCGAIGARPCCTGLLRVDNGAAEPRRTQLGVIDSGIE